MGRELQKVERRRWEKDGLKVLVALEKWRD